MTAAEDLHALLAAAGEHGPYVLVGHSIGGPYAMTYAARYPDQVAGMVLLDSSSPEQFTSIPSYPGQYAVMRRGVGAAPDAEPRRARPGCSPAPTSPRPRPTQVEAMTSTARGASNGRDELSVAPRRLRAGPGPHHAARPPARRAHRLREPLDGRAGPAPRTGSPHSRPTASTGPSTSSHDGPARGRGAARPSRSAPSPRSSRPSAPASALDHAMTTTRPPTPIHRHTTTTGGVTMSHTTHPDRHPTPHPPTTRLRTGGGRRPRKSWALLGRRPGRPDPGRPRHLRRQHRPARPSGAPCSLDGGQLQWLVTAYLMMSGGGLLLGGRIADLLSRRTGLPDRPGPVHRSPRWSAGSPTAAAS